MTRVIAKGLLALALFIGVTASASAETARSPVNRPAPPRASENDQEIADLQWEMDREDNERGHESFDPTPIGKLF